jgi:hypothetical protein
LHANSAVFVVGDLEKLANVPLDLASDLQCRVCVLLDGDYEKKKHSNKNERTNINLRKKKKEKATNK